MGGWLERGSSPTCAMYAAAAPARLPHSMSCRSRPPTQPASWRVARFRSGCRPCTTFRRARGAYWDGGITDYHLHLDYASMGEGLVLYPHFQKTVIPGWLDKAPHRHRATAHLDNVIVLSPRAEWIATPPNAKAARPRRLPALRRRSGRAHGGVVARGGESARLADGSRSGSSRPRPHRGAAAGSELQSQLRSPEQERERHDGYDTADYCAGPRRFSGAARVDLRLVTCSKGRRGMVRAFAFPESRWFRFSCPTVRAASFPAR